MFSCIGGWRDECKEKQKTVVVQFEGSRKGNVILSRSTAKAKNLMSGQVVSEILRPAASE